MSSGHDSFSKRQAVLFSFKEISFKKGIAANNANSHQVDDSSEMAIASFGDFACAFKLARLVNRRVNTSIGNKGLMGREVTNIAYLCKKSSSCRITDTVNGSNNLHLLNSDGLTEIRDGAGEFIQLFHQVKESRDFLGQDKLFSKAIGCNRIFGSIDNRLCVDRDFSAFAASVKSLCNNLSLSGSDKTGRGEFFKEQKHSSSKDITDGLQFRESSLENPFNLVFSGSNKVGDGLSFSGDIPEVSHILRNGELLNGILVDKKEPGDSKRVFFVGLGFMQRQFSEIGDKKWINDNRIAPFTGQRRKEIDMVAASGLHSYNDRREVFTIRSDSLHQFQKAVFVHSGIHGKTDITFAVKTCGREGILRNINTDKQFTHSSTSQKRYLGKAGDASRPILHNDKGLVTQSTYNGFGRQGTDSYEGSMTQVKWSSPAFPTLTGKTGLYKFYNTNS